jgi:hypothetical protein
MLLSTLLETPSLSSLLATHFSPMITSPPVYIQLYKSLTDTPQAVSPDLIFVLLSKVSIKAICRFATFLGLDLHN